MRSMLETDIDAVLSIEVAVQAYPWTRGNFSDALSHQYVCCVDQDAAGIHCYAILMPVLDEAELLTIGVATQQQRKGYGRAMLLEIMHIAHTKSLQRVYLEVRHSNAAAIALYRSVGFVEIGLRRGYYRTALGSEDALVMACKLSNQHHGDEQHG